MIHIQEAEFIISAVSEKQYPASDIPEIALAGRSNVGKSSFINAMINRKGLARTSSKPGKTQQLNYYKIANKFYFVDVPGYGYAKVSKTERNAWGEMLGNYFSTRENILMALLLVDFRHKPSKEDIAMKEFFDFVQVPYFVLATKSDKVKSGVRHKHIQEIYQTLGLQTPEQILPISAETKDGLEEAWEIILDQLESVGTYLGK